MARILVIDDNSAMLRALETGLTGFGHTVTVAADGAEGLKLADAQSVELVLLDVEMPRMSGLAVCEALKRDPTRRHLPVLMMTGRPSPGMVILAQKAGALAVVEKPFTWEELMEQFSRHLPAGV